MCICVWDNIYDWWQWGALGSPLAFTSRQLLNAGHHISITGKGTPIHWSGGNGLLSSHMKMEAHGGPFNTTSFLCRKSTGFGHHCTRSTNERLWLLLLYNCLSVCLSVHLSVCLSVCMSICLVLSCLSRPPCLSCLCLSMLMGMQCWTLFQQIQLVDTITQLRWFTPS